MRSARHRVGSILVPTPTTQQGTSAGGTEREMPVLCAKVFEDDLKTQRMYGNSLLPGQHFQNVSKTELCLNRWRNILLLKLVQLTVQADLHWPVTFRKMISFLNIHFSLPTLSLSTYMNYLKLLIVFFLVTLKFIVEWNQVFSISMKKLNFS